MFGRTIIYVLSSVLPGWLKTLEVVVIGKDTDFQVQMEGL